MSHQHRAATALATNPAELSTAATSVQLRIHREGETKTVNVTAPAALVIGRQLGCDVRLTEGNISRQHARIILGPDMFAVEDLSSNGTRLSTGEHLRRARATVPYGTALDIGPYRVVVSNAQMMETALPLVTKAPKIAEQTQSILEEEEKTPPPRRFSTRVSMERSTLPTGGSTQILRPEELINARGSHTPTEGVNVVHVLPTMASRAPKAKAKEVPAIEAPSIESGPASVEDLTLARPAHQNPSASIAAVAKSEEPRNVAVREPIDRASSPDELALRHRVHVELQKTFDLSKSEKKDPGLRSRVRASVQRILREQKPAEHIDLEALASEILAEAVGLGPLEGLLNDPNVTEITVVDPATIYVERDGRRESLKARFTDEDRVRAVIERLTARARRTDDARHMMETKLADGSWVHVIGKPFAVRGSFLSIRRPSKRQLPLDELLALETLSPRIARFLERAVLAKKNIVISGDAGTGKTAVMSALAGMIPDTERIATIEEVAELKLPQPCVLALETKEGEASALFKSALQERPERIIFGECRGGEIVDLLHAMGGHEGVMTSVRASSPKKALARLEALACSAGLSAQSSREQIAESVHVIVQMTRLSDGTCRVSEVAEVEGVDPTTGRFEVRPLFEFEPIGATADGKILGEFDATGYLPSFADELLSRGLVKPGEALI